MSTLFLNFLSPLFIILGIVGLILILGQAKEDENITSIYRRKLLALKEREKKLRLELSQLLSVHFSKSLINFLEKILIRLRIIVLRLDRSLFLNLKKLREIKFKKEFKKEKISTALLNHFKEEQEEKKDFKKEERLLLIKLKKNDPDVFQNLARLYLYEEDLSSARWIILEGLRRFKEEKIFEAFLIELFEKEKFSPKEEDEERKELEERFRPV